MEVVARDVALGELSVKDRVAVVVTRQGVGSADLVQLDVEVDVPLAHLLAALDVDLLGRRRVGQQRLADIPDRPDEASPEVALEQGPELVDVGDADDVDVGVR